MKMQNYDKILCVLFCLVLLLNASAQNGSSIHAVSGEYITEWLVLGPFFPDNLEKDFLDGVDGEEFIKPNAGDTVITAAGDTLTWMHVHGKHGKDYIDEARFADNNIKCIWQEFEHPVYQQQYEPFMPEMATIDLLFNHGPKSLEIITKKL